MEQELSPSGFTMVSNDMNELMPKMGASNFGIYFVLIRDSIGRGDVEVSKSLRHLARQSGCSVSTVQRAIKKLQRLGFIKVVKNGFQQLRFSMEGLKRSVDRGYQFTRQFLMRFGIAIKVKKPKPENKEGVLKTSTGCGQFDHMGVLNLTTYKDSKNLNTSPSGKLENSSPSKQEQIEYAKKIYETTVSKARYNYPQVLKECGRIAGDIIKAVGLSKILNSPAYLENKIRKEVEMQTLIALNGQRSAHDH